MIYLPTIPSRRVIEHKTLLQQAVTPRHFTSTSTTQVTTILGLPAQAVVTGVRVFLLTQFVAPSLTSITIQLGTTSLPNFYSAAYQLNQVPTDTTYQLTSPGFIEATTAAHDLVATFSATGNIINNISSGAVEITVQYRLV